MTPSPPHPRTTGRVLLGALSDNRGAAAALALVCAIGCDDGARPEPYGADGYGLAGGCFVIDAAAPGRSSGRLLVAADDGARFAFSGRDVDAAAKLYLKPADLGTYLLRDADGRYLVADADALGRAAGVGRHPQPGRLRLARPVGGPGD